MKKMMSVVCIAAMLAAVLLAVNASAVGTVTFSLSSNTSPARAGDTITISVKVSGVQSAGGLLAAGPVSLKYDTGKLTYVSAGGGPGIPDTDVMANHVSGEVLLDYIDVQGGANPLKTDATLFQVKFKVKDSASSGTTAFSIEIPDGAVADKNAQTVTAKKSGLTLLLAAARSDNADLTALIVSNASISPAFSKGVTSYTASVPFETASLLLAPTLADANASFKVSGNSLEPDKVTNVKITVTAESGKTKVYTIAVSRAADPNAPSTTTTQEASSSQAQQDATLKSLEVEGFVLSPVFLKVRTEYVVWVPFETTKVKVKAEANDGNATVTVTGGDNLVSGKNTVKVECKTADGSTKVYTVTVRRAVAHGQEDVSESVQENTTRREAATDAGANEAKSGVKTGLVVVIALLTLAAGCVGGVFLSPVLIQNRKF